MNYERRRGKVNEVAIMNYERRRGRERIARMKWQL